MNSIKRRRNQIFGVCASDKLFRNCMEMILRMLGVCYLERYGTKLADLICNERDDLFDASQVQLKRNSLSRWHKCGYKSYERIRYQQLLAENSVCCSLYAYICPARFHRQYKAGSVIAQLRLSILVSVLWQHDLWARKYESYRRGRNETVMISMKQ